jgi:hypothetical protein
MATSVAYIDGVCSRPSRRPVWRAVILAAAVLVMAGCSAGNDNGATLSALPSSTPSKQVGATIPPGSVGVSPAGVTTRISIPAQSTEEEYFQACHAATVWMQGRQGDRNSLIEAYLATVQTSGAGRAGTWNTGWHQLTPARQAAVIVAVQAAADGGCG